MSKVHIKIPKVLLDTIKIDLERHHAYAFERVGFCYGTSTKINAFEWVVIINNYMPVRDENYIKTNEVGARINSKAINEAFQYAFTNKHGLFHIHTHNFKTGLPQFGTDDLESGNELMLSFQNYVTEQLHGIIVLSKNSINAKVLLPAKNNLEKVDQISIIGLKIIFCFPRKPIRFIKDERYSRQSFLGENANELISRLKIGVVGLSGGGSHIVQQLAHIGFKRFVLADPDIIDDESNLNRVVGATLQDAKINNSKFEVFKRLINSLHSNPEILGGQKKWEEEINSYKGCDLVFGGLDTMIGRRDLENFCRRYLIPYIDIGMGIVTEFIPYAMFGQVQLSVPGYSCLKCNGFITDESLKVEANNYGQKTKRPQVIWPNGVLASTAVGIAINLITNWTANENETDYLSYDGNSHHLNDHIFKDYRPKTCNHYPISESGPLTL